MNHYSDEPAIVSKRGLIRARDNRQTSSNYETPAEYFLSMPSAGEQSNFANASSIDSTNLLSESFRDLDRKALENLSTKEKTNMLFPQFLEILQSRTNDSEVFDTIQDLIQTCTAILEEIIKERRTMNEINRLDDTQTQWLQQERDTWQLLYALYKDRLIVQKEDADNETFSLSGSEKEIVSQLYSNNAILREYQLVVDWLEASASEENSVEVAHFTDRTVAWENTLWQLRNPNTVAFGGNYEIVKYLDPDAPHREKKPLHPLDMEDDARLAKNMFSKIRQGRIEDAKSLCVYCGQSWRAAILEGWRLYEDPNIESGNVNEKYPIEGNPRRDLWKMCAYMFADNSKYDNFSRAICGALCGHLESLLNVTENSWLDLLWSYLKVQIDIRVESEIRSCCMKNYVSMPENYWNAKMTLDQIFDELSVHKNLQIRNESKQKIRIIQKLLIQDNISALLDNMKHWIEEEKLSSHMLRFLTHIVLFFRQIGKLDKENIADLIIKEYCEWLIGFGDSQLIAFYTAALSQKLQIIIYGKYLEGINDRETRCQALEEALSAGLDIDRITTYTVQIIRNRQPNIDEEKRLKTEITKLDESKISALEFLTFYNQHKGELLWQANAVIRTFLGENKIECVRKAFKIIPSESIEQIIKMYGSKDNLPCREECSIKEYLCHQTYLAAIDGFNDWTHLYHNRPKEPPQPKTIATFTEKMASEHKEQTFRADLNRWKINLMEQSKISRDLLFNILLFPDKGWLIDPDTVKEPNEIDLIEWEYRLVQMENLRKLCIPEIVLLLHKVLHLSGEYKDCVKLADQLAAEQGQLYKVYPKHKLAEILSKIVESSLALMNEKLDPWGYQISG